MTEGRRGEAQERPATFRGFTTMGSHRILRLCGVVLLVAVAACSKARKEPASAVAIRPDLPETYYLAESPAGARSVSDLIEHSQPGDQVVVEGRVGGSKDVFIEGIAWFSIVDASLKTCDLEGPMPECPTPWDYCCLSPDQLSRHKMGVEFSDGERPLRLNVRGFHGLDHKKLVTIVGEMTKDDAGNVAIRASGIHVHP